MCEVVWRAQWGALVAIHHELHVYYEAFCWFISLSHLFYTNNNKYTIEYVQRITRNGIFRFCVFFHLLFIAIDFIIIGTASAPYRTLPLSQLLTCGPPSLFALTLSVPLQAHLSFRRQYRICLHFFALLRLFGCLFSGCFIAVFYLPLQLNFYWFFLLFFVFLLQYYSCCY